MMRHRIQWFLMAIAIGLGLSACDPVAPIFLRNGTPTQLTIHAKFDGETMREGELQPGMRMAFMHPYGEIEHLAVLSGNQVLHEFDKSELKRMAESVADPRKVTWNIERGAVVPLTQADLERIEDPR